MCITFLIILTSFSCDWCIMCRIKEEPLQSLRDQLEGVYLPMALGLPTYYMDRFQTMKAPTDREASVKLAAVLKMKYIYFNCVSACMKRFHLYDYLKVAV